MFDKDIKSPGLAVGIDLGATKTTSVLISPNGEVFDQHKTPTNASKDPMSAFETVIAHINKYHEVYSDKIIGIGIGTPGWSDPDTKKITNAVNIGWENFGFIQEIRNRLGIKTPIFHQTDALAETVGEYYFGSAQGFSDFVYLGIGSGLGGGIFIQNQLVTGTFGMAGAAGHFEMGASKETCVCGLKGCAEQRIGGIALTNILNELSDNQSITGILGKEQYSDHRAVLAAAHKKDRLAISALLEMGKWLGVIMSMFITILNPQLVVIGGGLGIAAYPLIVPEAIREARQRTLPAYWKNLEIKASSVFSSAAGAACLVWEPRKREVVN